MSDQDRIAALEREVATLKADMAQLGAQLTDVKARVDRKVPPPAIRGGQPVFG